MPNILQIPVYNTTKTHIIYETPVIPEKSTIDGYGLPKKDQKFTRWKYPTDKDFDKLSPGEQDKIIDFVLYKREYGHWFFNNGVITYITGVHWFYLTFWRLDVGLPLP